MSSIIIYPLPYLSVPIVPQLKREYMLTMDILCELKKKRLKKNQDFAILPYYLPYYHPISLLCNNCFRNSEHRLPINTVE